MRRLKEHNEEAEEELGEINLVPYMDIVTNIIIFLLAVSATQVPLGNVNTSAPTLSAGGGAAIEQPKEQPLNLTITVAANGFVLAGSGAVLPTLPKLPDGQYDYQALTKTLADVKKDNQQETRATFNADAYVPYDTVVKTLDAMREDEAGKPLFPDIVFAAGIL